MRYLRTVIVILFIVAAVAFGYSEYRIKVNEDSTLPVITGSNEMLQLNCDYNESDLLTGLSAYDEKDGDLTDKIMVGSVSRFYSTGKFKVTYVVFDSGNNPGTFTRDAEFTDYVSPEFTLSEPLVFTEGNSSSEYESLGAVDVVDGDISNAIRFTYSSVNFKTSGDYQISVEVSNSFGDVQKLNLPVHIVESTNIKMKINLSENLVYIKKGDKFDPKKYLVSVDPLFGEDVDKNTVKITSGVKTDAEGCYEVKYEVSGAGDSRGVAWLTVVVR